MKIIITLCLSFFMTSMYAQKTIVISSTSSGASSTTVSSAEIKELKSILDKIKAGELTESSFSKIIIDDIEGDTGVKVPYKIIIDENSDVTDIEAIKSLDISELEESVKELTKIIKKNFKAKKADGTKGKNK